MRILGYIVGVIVLLFIAITALGAYGPEFGNYLEEKKYERLQKKADEQMAELELAYQNDFDGGKTPEETFDLLIQALESGDIEQASKYYTILDQEKALKGFEDELKKNGNLESSITSLNNIKNKGYKKDISDIKTSFIYEYITTETSTSTLNISRQTIILVTPKGSSENIGISFKLNEYTDIWKAVQP